MKRSLSFFIFLSLLFIGCENETPEPENVEEIITDVTLTFTPDDGGDAVIARAQDPDGEGVKDLEILDDIVLAINTSYTLEIKLENSIEGENITEEVEEEADEHMFFFEVTNDIFTNPTGDGNVSDRDGKVLYNDEDDNGLPLGISTDWETGDAKNGTFRVVLKHQPNVKSETSTVQDGSTDVDLEWVLTIE